MNVAFLLTGLLALAAKGGQRVLNHARVLDRPHYWGRAVGDVERGAKVDVLESKGGWLKVRTGERGVEGYIPGSALEDMVPVELHFANEGPKTASAAQAANASRGFSREVNAADVKKSNLSAADGWVHRYETGDLERQLSEAMPAFVQEGGLRGGAP